MISYNLSWYSDNQRRPRREGSHQWYGGLILFRGGSYGHVVSSCQQMLVAASTSFPSARRSALSLVHSSSFPSDRPSARALTTTEAESVIREADSSLFNPYAAGGSGGGFPAHTLVMLHSWLWLLLLLLGMLLLPPLSWSDLWLFRLPSYSRCS